MIAKELGKRYSWVAVLCFLAGCGILKNDKKESQSKKGVIEIIDNKNNEVISFHEVHRLSDKTLIQVLESIPEIDGFTPIYALDYQNYQQNVVGVTDKEANKKRIMDELAKLNSLPENLFFCWSKWKQENRIINENFYYLYLLKNLDKESRIKNEEISKAEVMFNKFANETEIRIKFNEPGTEKWSKMTEKAARNNNDFIAMVVDFEVYSCPYVMTPIYSGDALILGFDDKIEAEKIVKRIEAMKNKKSKK